ncbi:MAG: pirin family protein [Vampirovibrionales bacterium]
MQSGRLRVLNHDIIAPLQGFGMHGHRNMTIVTLVCRGMLQHEDTLGNRRLLKAGDIQVMEAGTGIRHSEINPDANTPCELYQLWLLPPQQDRSPPL